MQQEVAEWMDDLVTQRIRNCKHAAVDDCPSGRSGDGLHVANAATDLLKQFLAS
jgi:hypothetical protein